MPLRVRRVTFEQIIGPHCDRETINVLRTQDRNSFVPPPRVNQIRSDGFTVGIRHFPPMPGPLYAKRTKKADTTAAAAIAKLFKGGLT